MGNNDKFVLELDEEHQVAPQVSTTPFRHTFEVEYYEPTKSASQKRRVSRADVLTDKDKEVQSFQGYRAPTWKLVLFYAMGLCSCGLTFLLSKWSPRMYILLGLSQCPLDQAEHVLVRLLDGQEGLTRVQLIKTYDACGNAPGLSPTFEHQATSENLLDWQTTAVHRLLEHRCCRYFYVDSASTFIPVPPCPATFNRNLQQTAILASTTTSPALLDAPEWDLQDRQRLYGANEMKVPVKSVGALVFDEMWHPFYVFQYFSIFIWVAGDAYYTYSVCIALITWFSIITSAFETHSNMRRLADIAEFSCQAEALRAGDWTPLPSTELVPGDIITLTPGVLPCDIVLLKGECIVDENMLTGESVPVRKVAYSPVADALSYSPDASSACTLYGGTLVAQARAPRAQRALGMVVRTRFYSAKGELLRSILHPKEVAGSFMSDSLIFIAIMSTGCLLMFAWSASVLWAIGAPPGRIAWRFFDMITIAVPPALPACLTICTIFAIGRLRDKGVYVTSPDRIAMAGHLEVICFDKTGTLTEPGLHLKGITAVGEGAFKPLLRDPRELPAIIEQLLASCHGLARMGDALVGDPLDQKLFEATGWTLIDDGHDQHQDDDGPSPPGSPSSAAIHTWVQPSGSPDRYAVLRRFEFTSAAQRNGVVVRYPDGRVHLFVKGSPEMVRGMVQAWSVPADFDAVLGSYTREGLRMLALAMADLSGLGQEQLMGMTQEEAEAAAPLQLLGLAAMENPLRDDSAEVILKLQTARIRCVMVTGDHVRTAISVAHHCSLLSEKRPVALLDGAAAGVPAAAGAPSAASAGAGAIGGLHVSLLQPNGELTSNTTIASVLPKIMCGEYDCAVTGKAFRTVVAAQDTLVLPALLRHAGVFARMSPDDKRDLVQLMGDGLVAQEARPGLGLFVGFCGDGANDCGALKAAHVGVSLCEAEASVAAPMTSKVQSIASMVTVVAEGRCTLMATYQIFQFIIGYALVQAFSTNLMYSYGLNLGDYQFLIQDLFFTTVLAGLMGYTAPRTVLAPDRPLKRVMSLPLMMSTVSQLITVVAFQCIALAALHARPGYHPSKGSPDLRTVQTPENSTVYLMDLGQFIILALVFNKGYPHRSPIHTNLSLTLSLALQALFLLFSIFSTATFNTKVQQLVGAHDPLITPSFRVIILILLLANLFAAGLAELLLTPLVLWVANHIRDGIQHLRGRH